MTENLKMKKNEKLMHNSKKTMEKASRASCSIA